MATAQEVFAEVLRDHAAPWLRAQGFKGTGAHWSRHGGGFELRMQFWKNRYSTRDQVLCQIRTELLHQPSVDLTRRLHPSVSDTGRPIVVTLRNWPRLVPAGGRRYTTVQATDSVATMAPVALGELDELVTMADRMMADPYFETGVTAVIHDRAADDAWFQPLPTALQPPYDDIAAAVIAGGPDLGSALRLVTAILTGVPSTVFPDHDRMGDAVLAAVLDHPAIEVQREAATALRFLRLGHRLDGAARWWQARYRGVRTVDGRDTDDGVAYTAATTVEAAAARFGLGPGEVVGRDGPLFPAPPWMGAHWRHPDDEALPIWHRGRCDTWAPAAT